MASKPAATTEDADEEVGARVAILAEPSGSPGDIALTEPAMREAHNHVMDGRLRMQEFMGVVEGNRKWKSALARIRTGSLLSRRSPTLAPLTQIQISSRSTAHAIALPPRNIHGFRGW